MTMNLERMLDWLVRPNNGFPDIINPRKISPSIFGSQELRFSDKSTC